MKRKITCFSKIKLTVLIITALYMPVVVMSAVVVDKAISVNIARRADEISSGNIVIVFSVLIVILATFLVLSLHKRIITEQKLAFEMKKNDIIIGESSCEQFVYYVKNDSITVKGELLQNLTYPSPRDFSSVCLEMISVFPGLEKCVFTIKQSISKVIKTGKKTIVDLPIKLQGKYLWIKIVFVPMAETGNHVSHVIASLFDVTYLHEEFKKNVAFLENIPGGIQMLRLTKPIECEYLGEGFCKMTGYNKEELYEKLQDGNYTNIVFNEDIPKVTAFIDELSKGEIALKCEYRIVRKDGSIITVSDTAETVLSSNGILFCYCVVVDVSEKEREIEEAKNNIKEKERREEILLKEQRLLAAAAKKAYSMIVSANLTQNTYSIIEYENITANKAFPDHGEYDILVETCAGTIPDKEQADVFVNMFSRKALIDAFYEGKTTVSLRHKQVGDDGTIHWNDTSAVFVSDGNEKDIRIVSLVNSADDDQRQVEKLEDALKMTSVYKEAILTTCAGYLEVDFTTGYIVGDILSSDDNNETKNIIIPGISSTMKYDGFVKNLSRRMEPDDSDTFIRLASSSNIIKIYKKGIRYYELPCKIKLEDNMLHDFQYTLFLYIDDRNGDIRGICVLNDVSEQEKNRLDVVHLTEELRESRIKNSISQMHPHFLYNALASIREVMLDDPQYASDLLYDFTTHLRACVRSASNNDLVTFTQELENIKAFVNIEKMRFGEKLKVKYEIDCSDFMIVPLSVQPLVENSIRHGIYERGAIGGTVTISSAQMNDCYIITVQDDGVGFDYEKVKLEAENGSRDSTGLSNLIFRLEKMVSAKVTIHSQIEVGTRIEIKIPIQNNEGNTK